MKRTLLLTIAGLMLMPLLLSGQSIKPKVKSSKKDILEKRSMPFAIKDVSNMLMLTRENRPMNPDIDSETNIGLTRYDLQTNQSTANRLYRHPDGTIAGVWTRGISETAFPDRGTGYNYFDGTSWGPMPSQRIEPLRTGWPSYAPLGPGGEIVVSHTDVAGLSVDKRDTKGSGNWVHSILPGPLGAVDISWPRASTSGANHDKVHVIACTYVPYQGQDQALLYYRSPDGGNSWDKQHVILPGTGVADYLTFGGDSYAWAPTKGDTLAFVVGDNWIDLFMMKSFDGGENWTKTVIFQHPYPLFDETHTIVADTPTVCDGSLSIILDQQGDAHVFFGLMRVLNLDTTDAQTSFFPYTDGLAYWREGMPMMTNISYDTLDAKNQIVGHTLDLNGNDTILEFVDLGTYYLSVTSMPYAAISEDGKIFLVMTSVSEELDNGSQNYRHLYFRNSNDNGNTWTEMRDLTSGLTHNFHECVFPCLVALDGLNYGVLFQMDDEPGLAVRGDADPYGDNNIVFLTSLANSISNPGSPALSLSGPFPNPATHHSMLSITLDGPAPLSLSVLDITGKVVYTENKGEVMNGTHGFLVPTSQLRAGVYLIRLQAGYHAVAAKLVVQ